MIARPAKPGWRQSLLARSGLALLALLLIVGSITVIINTQVDRVRAEHATMVRLNHLFDTVASTASVACYARDEGLARELVSGILNNPEVLSVTIEADGNSLASLSQPGEDQLPAGAAQEAPLVRDVGSPFAPKQTVGRILLTPNRTLIDQQQRRAMAVDALEVTLQVILVALAFAVATVQLIIRPIRSISEQLNRMDLTGGDRLTMPPGQQGSEIGLLVDKVNELAGELVAALEEERALRSRQRLDQERFLAIFQNAETGLFIMDDQGQLSSFNPALARLMRLESNTDSAQSRRSLFSLDWSEPARVMELFLACISTGEKSAMVLAYRNQAGTQAWANMVLTPLTDQSIQGVIYDVTQHLEAEQSAKQLAITDQITGVANRLGLEQRTEQLVQAWNLNQSSGFALVLISLDDFKRLTAGSDPAIGEHLLRETTGRLSESVKATDLVARLDDNQFALLLPDLIRSADIERVTDRVLAALRRAVLIGGVPTTLKVAAGIAVYPQDTDADATTLIRHADLALTRAKVRNKGGLSFFDSSLARLAEDRRRLETDLRRAIPGNQLILFFQPIVDIVRGQIAGAEVLIRWRHPRRGLIPPDTFIPLAEETGIVTELGRWVLEASARQLAAWQSQGRDLYLSVNVSAHQIPHELPNDLLRDLIERHQFTPGSLALEITEGIFISDVGGVQTWLENARASGFPIFLDDFGTGYSSLSYLKHFPVDRLKIDRGFIRDIVTNPSDRSLVEAITAMARGFKMEVIAEGVEDPAHIRLLQQLGCRYAQGYFFSQPAPLDDFLVACERIPRLLESAAGPAPDHHGQPDQA